MQVFLKRLLILITLISVIRSTGTRFYDINTPEGVERARESEVRKEACAIIEDKKRLLELLHNIPEQIGLLAAVMACLPEKVFRMFLREVPFREGPCLLDLELFGIPMPLCFIAASCLLFPMLKWAGIIKSINIRVGMFLFILYLRNPEMHANKSFITDSLLKPVGTFFLLFVLAKYQRKRAKGKSVLSTPQKVRNYIYLLNTLLICYLVRIKFLHKELDSNIATLRRCCRFWW